jgi:hypothetical protein
MLGREGEGEASGWSSVEPSSCFSRYVGGMIIEDQLDHGAGRIRGVKKLEEFDELSAAVAVSDQGMDLPGKQVDAGQQAEGTVTFVLMIPREGRVDARHGRQIRLRRCDGLDSRLFVVGNDRHALDGFARPGGGFFQNLDLAVDTENLRHLLLKFGVATFQIVAHLVWLDFFVSKNLAHRALGQASPDEELSQAISRVRTWTREGLLRPSGKTNTGTGKPREYSKEAVVDAFLIDTFVQCFGSGVHFTAAVLVPKFLKNIRPYFIDEKQRDKFLLIGRTSGDPDFHTEAYAPAALASAIKSSKWHTYMVLDIGQLTERLALGEK